VSGRISDWLWDRIVDPLVKWLMLGFVLGLLLLLPTFAVLVLLHALGVIA
jgi:hypothetical protein